VKRPKRTARVETSQRSLAGSHLDASLRAALWWRPNRCSCSACIAACSCSPHGHLLPLGRRLVRSRDLRLHLRLTAVEPARPSPSRRRRAPRQRRPAEPRRGPAPPPTVHADFPQAFAHALHGVFLWGMAIAIVPFALSWFLKEMPLRTTLHRPVELGAEQATARSATAEEIVQPHAPANPAG
jgi:hypothetical protein